MTTLRFACLATLAVALTAAPVHAQIGFGVAGGPSFPTGDLSNQVNSGFHGGIVLDFGIPLVPFGVRGDVFYHQFPGTGDASNLRQISGTVNGRFSLLPLPLISAYLTAGAGLYASDFEPDPAADGSWSSDIGINGGVGARVNLLVIRPFVEARYHHVLSDPSRAFVPITIGFFF